jgi:hypothetical protein
MGRPHRHGQQVPARDTYKIAPIGYLLTELKRRKEKYTYG